MYTPYSQLDLDVIESIGGHIQELYATKSEMFEDQECECDYSIIEVDGVVLELDCGNWLSMDSIGLN